MPNKRWEKLNELDRILRLASPVGMNDGVHVTIELFSGFEKFNTRAYHNYCTWSDGYRVTGKGVTVEAEDLDDAIKVWAEKVRVNALQEKVSN
jgi:hypothetical protein